MDGRATFLLTYVCHLLGGHLRELVTQSSMKLRSTRARVWQAARVRKTDLVRQHATIRRFADVLTFLQDDDAFPPVVAVNVGGTLFTTTLSTLCRYPESLLGVMFSGRHRILRDACGRPFIDFDPDRFRPVLEFLRTETLPPSDRSVDVYQAAAYFAVEPLRERLTCFAPVARMLVQTSYRDRFRNYEQLRYHVVKTATEKAAVDAGHRTIVRVLIKRGTSTHDDTDKDHMCVRSEADFDLESFKVTAADAAADAVSGTRHRRTAGTSGIRTTMTC
jgi:hypothetical protein